jgi:hypothetical protein
VQSNLVVILVIIVLAIVVIIVVVIFVLGRFGRQFRWTQSMCRTWES